MGRRQTFRPDPALEGIEQNLDPGAPLNDNCSDLIPRQLREIGIDLLPRTQLHALEAFEDDPLIDSVPGGFKAICLQQKMRESNEGFHAINEAHLGKRFSFI